jgi:hypothetical protein
VVSLTGERRIAVSLTGERRVTSDDKQFYQYE